MCLDKITKLVFDVKCLLAFTAGVSVNKAGAVKLVIIDSVVPVKDGDFN